MSRGINEFKDNGDHRSVATRQTTYDFFIKNINNADFRAMNAERWFRTPPYYYKGYEEYKEFTERARIKD